MMADNAINSRWCLRPTKIGLENKSAPNNDSSYMDRVVHGKNMSPRHWHVFWNCSKQCLGHVLWHIQDPCATKSIIRISSRLSKTLLTTLPSLLLMADGWLQVLHRLSNTDLIQPLACKFWLIVFDGYICIYWTVQTYRYGTGLLYYIIITIIERVLDYNVCNNC